MSQSKAVRIVAGYVLFLGFFGAYAYALSLANYVIPASGRAAMQWVQENTPPSAHFVVLTGSPDPFSDTASEWFPAFTGRTSESTIQGQEWTLAGEFVPFLNSLQTLQSCLNQGSACLEDWAAGRAVDFDYVYIEKPVEKNASSPSRVLSLDLAQDQNYSRVFENEGVIIFVRK